MTINSRIRTTEEPGVADGENLSLPNNMNERTPPNGVAKTSEKSEMHTTFTRPKGLRLALIVVGVGLALLCIFLDRTIVSTAIPKITSEFNSLGDVAWYGSSYLFGTCAFQLLFGKLYSRISVKWTFIVSLLIFEVGSVVCGAAPNSVALIIGRAIAGIGSGGVMSGALIIAALVVELKDRPKYIGGLSGVMGIAFVGGPTLGGAFTNNVSWRWCFYINLPLGAVTFIATILLVNLPPPSQPSPLREHLRHLDLVGTAIFIPCVISLLLAFQWAGTTYPWDNWRIILLFCVTGVLAIVWGAVQRLKGEHATVPVRIISQRSIWSGLFQSATIGAATFIIAYFVPVWFQSVKDYSPQASGVNYLAMSVASPLTSVVAGLLTSKTGYYVPSMYLGAVILSAGGAMQLLWDQDTTTAFWLGTLIVVGVGVGFGFQSSFNAAQAVLRGTDISIGTSLMVLGQTLGGAVFLSAGQTVFSTRLLRRLDALEVSSGVDPALVQAAGAAQLATAMGRVYPPATVRAIVAAYNASLRGVWIEMLVLSAASVLGAVTMEWRSVKREGTEAGEAGQVPEGESV